MPIFIFFSISHSISIVCVHFASNFFFFFLLCFVRLFMSWIEKRIFTFFFLSSLSTSLVPRCVGIFFFFWLSVYKIYVDKLAFALAQFKLKFSISISFSSFSPSEQQRKIRSVIDCGWIFFVRRSHTLTQSVVPFSFFKVSRIHLANIFCSKKYFLFFWNE